MFSIFSKFKNGLQKTAVAVNRKIIGCADIYLKILYRSALGISFKTRCPLNSYSYHYQFLLQLCFPLLISAILLP